MRNFLKKQVDFFHRVAVEVLFSTRASLSVN